MLGTCRGRNKGHGTGIKCPSTKKGKGGHLTAQYGCMYSILENLQKKEKNQEEKGGS